MTTVKFYKLVGRFLSDINKINHDLSEEQLLMIDAKEQVLTKIEQLKTDLTAE